MMNKTAITLVLAGVILLAGFMFLRSRPVQNSEPVQQSEQVSPEAGASAVTTDKTTGTPSVITTMPTTKQLKQYSQPPAMKIESKKSYTAVITTNKGLMKVNLLASEAPNAVNNFVFLSKEGFYDQTIFHRIIKGFMIQGGDPQGDGRGGPGYKFADEPIKRDYKRGIVAMANSGPNTNGSQFFVMHADTPLQKNYVIFGELVGEESLKTLDKIADTPVKSNMMDSQPSSPTEKVVTESIKIEEK